MNTQISEVEKDRKDKMMQHKSKSLTFGNVLFDSEMSDGRNGADTGQIVKHQSRQSYGASLARSLSTVNSKKILDSMIPDQVKRVYDFVARIVCSDYFNGVSGFIVIMNSISIGVQTDYIAR